MVVVEGGFRDRWQHQFQSRQLGADGSQCEDSQQEVFGSQRDEFSDVADDSFLHVHGFAGFDAEGSPDLLFDPEQNLEQNSILSEGSQPRFLEPRPKSRPQSTVREVTRSLGVKRTADEFASMKVHGHFSEMKQPWQRGPLSPLFAKQKSFWERPATASLFSVIGMSDHVTASDSAAAIPRPVKQLEATVQRLRMTRVVSSDDDFRRLSLSRFKTMVLLEVDATRLGLSLLTFAGTLCSNEELGQIFNDVFAPKSSGTILKRCNSMWRFSCWLQTKFLGSPFNQSEGIVYAYICHLRASEAGATTPAQFVEALRFSNALLGFCKTSLDDMLSARVVAASHSIYLTKRVRRPAEVLTVSEVQQLEAICLQDESLHHRVIAGHFLFCMMAAARWHDSMHVVSMELSKADHLCLLEAATSKHKSSRTKEQQRELLPFTALGQTLAVENWADSWLSAREDSCSFGWCHFLCSWSEHQGDWADTKMSTAEATFWLRELLEPMVGPDRSAVLTVHGLKATMLSWAAKSMLFTPEEQLALGHHVSSHYKSALIYSRDNQIGLCKKIYDMMDKIKAGTFNPDGSRVQRLLQLTMARAQELQSEDDSDTSSTSTDASSVASSEGEHREPEPSSFRRLDAADIDRDHCFINTRSRVVHLQLLGQQKFWCGRCASSSFRKASRDDLANAETVICASCSHSFRAANPDDAN